MDIRTLVLGLGVFCATFLAGWWFNIGAVVYGSSASQPPPAAAAEVTSGQGQAQGQSQGPSTQRLVAYGPISTGEPRATAQPKTPAAKLPKVKYAQEPRANASSLSSSSPKVGIRVRRR